MSELTELEKGLTIFYRDGSQHNSKKAQDIELVELEQKSSISYVEEYTRAYGRETRIHDVNLSLVDSAVLYTKDSVEFIIHNPGHKLKVFKESR